MRVAVLPAIFATTLPLAAQNPEPAAPAAPAVAPPAAGEPLPIAPVPLPEGIQMLPGNSAAIPDMPKNVAIRDLGPSTASSTSSSELASSFASSILADSCVLNEGITRGLG